MISLFKIYNSSSIIIFISDLCCKGKIYPNYLPGTQKSHQTEDDSSFSLVAIGESSSRPERGRLVQRDSCRRRMLSSSQRSKVDPLDFLPWWEWRGGARWSCHTREQTKLVHSEPHSRLDPRPPHPNRAYTCTTLDSIRRAHYCRHLERKGETKVLNFHHPLHNRESGSTLTELDSDSWIEEWGGGLQVIWESHSQLFNNTDRKDIVLWERREYEYTWYIHSIYEDEPV